MTNDNSSRAPAMSRLYDRPRLWMTVMVICLLGAIVCALIFTANPKSSGVMMLSLTFYLVFLIGGAVLYNRGLRRRDDRLREHYQRMLADHHDYPEDWDN